MDTKNITSFFNKAGEKFVEMSERVGSTVLLREAAIVLGASIVAAHASTMSGNPWLFLGSVIGGGGLFNTLAIGAGEQYNREFKRYIESTRGPDYYRNNRDHNDLDMK